MANIVTTAETCDREIPKLVDAIDGLLHSNPEKPEANLANIRRAIEAASVIQLELIAMLRVVQYEARKAAR